jgi:hypothetical protein
VKDPRIVEDARDETQNEITAGVVDQKADYVLGLKGNRGSLHEAGPDYFVTDEAAEF